MSRTTPGAGDTPRGAEEPLRPRSTGPRWLCGGLLACCFAATLGHGPATTAKDGTVPRAERTEAADPGLAADRLVTRFATPDDAEAWARLPARVRGPEGRLPAWARVLARTLPRTTAAMLELDYLQRARGPLDPKLRAQVRWAVARASRSAYGEAYALADLRAAGASADDLHTLSEDPRRLPDDTRAALTFARKLTTAAYSITDGEVARLTAAYGEKGVVALVLAVAYAGFQDRMALALGLTVEPGGPVPPLDVRFARRGLGAVTLTPARVVPQTPAADDVGGLADPDWGAHDLPALRTGMAAQKTRRPRITLPPADRSANRWGMVARAYQPEVADAWAACTQAFGEEADQDPVFEQSLFWVVTRTKQCFY